VAELSWWSEVVFGGWQGRTGPRYQRLAAALLDAVDRRVVAAGTRVPSERQLAAAVGASRGTVVACFEQLVGAGVLRRQVGAGTFVVGRVSWTAPPLRGGAGAGAGGSRAGLGGIDLSAGCPGDLSHLPAVDVGAAWAELDGHGVDPRGRPALREAVARHLSVHQQLPTSAEQIVITGGAQEALFLLGRVLRPDRVAASCPTYPGLAAAFGSGRLVGVARDDARFLSRYGMAYVMPTGHNPVGSVMPGLWRQGLAAVADAGRCVVVEDLALCDLVLDGGSVPQPVAALSSAVIAVGSVAKLLWGGLRVGWIRAESAALRELLVEGKGEVNGGTSVVAQGVAGALLSVIDGSWLEGYRAALRERRDFLCGLLSAALPAWEVVVPAAGMSLWVRLPVVDAAAFAHVALRFGVVVGTGAEACACGEHLGFVRLSFALPAEELRVAVERLAAAWEVHAQNLAAGVAPGGG
jgi:DNA-binding transcriptional MocR family regulator